MSLSSPPVSACLGPGRADAVLARLPHHWVAAEELSPAERRLLDHRATMTSTLEAAFGDRLKVQPVASHVTAGKFARQAYLALEKSGRLVCATWLFVDRQAMSPRAFAAITEGREPFGRVMVREGRALATAPHAYFRLGGREGASTFLTSPFPEGAAGRVNRVIEGQGDESLAETIEILLALP
ncbi:hypothetical protein [Parvularcula bermudensis]|nr:hypothetical protein [Parvularcula bermudensis]